MVRGRSLKRKSVQTSRPRRELSRTPKVVRNRKCRAKPRFSRDLVTPSSNDRALRRGHFARSRTVSERSSRGKGYFRGKPKIASMSNGDDCICNHRRCDSKRNFRVAPKKADAQKIAHPTSQDRSVQLQRVIKTPKRSSNFIIT